MSRAGLAIHGPVVELLHVMGAPDRYVARQFQSHVLGLAVRGGLAGTLLAAATLFALTRAGGEFSAGLMPDISLTPVQLLADRGPPDRSRAGGGDIPPHRHARIGAAAVILAQRVARVLLLPAILLGLALWHGWED